MVLQCIQDLTAAQNVNEAYDIMSSVSHSWLSSLSLTMVDVESRGVLDGHQSRVMESLWHTEEAIRELLKVHERFRQSNSGCTIWHVSHTWLSTLERLDLDADAPYRVYKFGPRRDDTSAEWLAGITQVDIEGLRVTLDDKHIVGDRNQHRMTTTSLPYDSSNFWSSDSIVPHQATYGSEHDNSMSCEPSFFQFNCRL